LTTTVHVAVRAEQADDQLRRQFDLLFDALPAQGPAAALVAAWLRDPDAAWLVLACDMPALERDTLRALVNGRDSSRGGTAWRTPDDDLPEPLCAIWEPATLARLAAAVRQAGNGPGSGTGPVSPRAILAAADPLLLNQARPAALISLNTPADLHDYLELRDGHTP
jgi:molybdopterin-guanine dinucleotide biosynthesis protein A